MIRTENLTKIFRTASASPDVTALYGIDLHVAPGDIFGVIGMSGAGKSTLLRCIAQLETPTGGSIYIDGDDVTRLSGARKLELRKKVGVIFQGYHLLMQRTVRGNVAFPLELEHRSRAQIDTRVDELLELVGLTDKADFYPAQLSGGQMQRVAIARALANEPRILLCDEPTSALDSLTTRSILSLLKSINQRLGVTIFLITHEIGVVKAICNKVAVINGGRLVEQGETGAILSNPHHPVTRLLLGLEDIPNTAEGGGQR